MGNRSSSIRRAFAALLAGAAIAAMVSSGCSAQPAPSEESPDERSVSFGSLQLSYSSDLEISSIGEGSSPDVPDDVSAGVRFTLTNDDASIVATVSQLDNAGAYGLDHISDYWLEVEEKAGNLSEEEAAAAEELVPGASELREDTEWGEIDNADVNGSEAIRRSTTTSGVRSSTCCIAQNGRAAYLVEFIAPESYYEEDPNLFDEFLEGVSVAS